MQKPKDIIAEELAKGPRTEEKLIAKCAEIGYVARGVRVALTRGVNSGDFKQTSTGSYALA